MSDISLLKDVDNGLITIGVGGSYATITIGEWSDIIARPRMYKKPISACEMVHYHAPAEDPA